MLIQLVAGIAVIAFILYRQMRPSPIGNSPRGAVILTAIGAFGALDLLQHGHLSLVDTGLLVVSTLLGLGISLARAHTIAIYRDPVTGAGMSKGTPMTLVLWVVAIAVHFGIDALASKDIGSSTILLYIGSVLLIQNLVVTARARHVGISAPAAVKV